MEALRRSVNNVRGRSYGAGVRSAASSGNRTGAGPLIEVLERAEIDFSARLAVVEKVLNDLRAAEYRLMRG
jgi:hypothetical protein